MTKLSKMYLLLTFLITWGCWWSLSVLSSNDILKFGEIPFWILYVIGGNGPFIAALVVKKSYADKVQFKSFKEQLFKVRNNAGWYLWIVITLFILGSIPWIISTVSSGFSELLLRKPIYFVILMLPVMVIGGGLEEVGWRGILLPEMLNKLPKFVTALVIGVIWTLWHLPLWFIKGVPQENSSYLLFFISVIGLSILLTILYDRTRSVFLCILFHSLTNTYSFVLNSPDVNPYISSAVKLTFCVLMFIAFEIFTMKFSKTKKTYLQNYK